MAMAASATKGMSFSFSIRFLEYVLVPGVMGMQSAGLPAAKFNGYDLGILDML